MFEPASGRLPIGFHHVDQRGADVEGAQVVGEAAIAPRRLEIRTDGLGQFAELGGATEALGSGALGGVEEAGVRGRRICNLV